MQTSMEVGVKGRSSPAAVVAGSRGMSAEHPRRGLQSSRWYGANSPDLGFILGSLKGAS